MNDRLQGTFTNPNTVALVRAGADRRQLSRAGFIERAVRLLDHLDSAAPGTDFIIEDSEAQRAYDITIRSAPSRRLRP